MQPSSKHMFRPSRLLRPASRRPTSKLSPASKDSSNGCPKALNSGRPIPVEEPLSKQKTTHPTGGKNNQRASPSDNAGPLSKEQRSVNGNSCLGIERPHGGPTRAHTLGGRGPEAPSTMRASDMDRKREAFLEHLKQKYPHHASAIMGHQERLQERVRSVKSAGADQGGCLSTASLESLHAMSEVGETQQAFTRGSRTRASLPVVRSANQTKDRSLGLLYLQYGEETKQVRMPNEVTGDDTIRALFVSAFPQHLTMEMLESPSVAVYIRDDTRNVYHELADMKAVTDHSFLKIYHKDPGQAFNQSFRPSNGDIRVQPFGREVPHILRQQSLPLPSRSHAPTRQLSSPPTSPTRIPLGTRGSVIPPTSRDRLSSAPPISGGPSCPSAILERRDVKPDEDSQAVPSPLADSVDHPGPHHQRTPPGALYPGPATVVDIGEHPGLYRQRSRRYADGQLPTLGSKTPPLSPHKAGEARLLEVHRPHQVVALERGTLGRQSLRREASLEAAAKTRGGMASPLTQDVSMATTGDPQTRERMKAMEEQIASLTGLVQHALAIAPGSGTAKEASSGKSPNVTSPGSSVSSGGGSPVPLARSRVLLVDEQVLHTCPSHIRASLASFSKTMSDLRQQLQEMRQWQLQSQESLRLMLVHAKQEIGHKVAALAQFSDSPVQRQRALVDDERRVYQQAEEDVLLELGELEQCVAELKQGAAPGTSHRRVTLRDVDNSAVRLKAVGETLAALKGEFPDLQAKMRAVLRVEVEAVRFLKEEPHKLDTMLKRVKSLTEALSDLKRCAAEGRPGDAEPSVPETLLTEHVAIMTASESAVAQEHLPLPAADQEPAVAGRNQESPAPKRAQVLPQEVTVKEQSSTLKEQEPPITVTPQETSPTLMMDSPPPVTTPEPPKVTKPPDLEPLPGDVMKEQQPPVAAQEPSPLLAQTSPQPITAAEPLPPVVSHETPPSPPECHGASVHSEVVPTSPVVIHHACSSPVEVQRSQQSAALSRLPSPPLTPPHSRDGLPVATPDSQNQDSSPALQKRGIHSLSGSAEQPQSGRNIAKSRAMSIEAAKKEWEEYQRMPDFDRLLQEAQATMMMSIPNLEVTDPVQERTCTAPAGQSAPLEPKADKPRKPNSTEGPPTPTKSPPPPPPRRAHPPGSGLTTGRSGEVIYTKKESVTPQDGPEHTPCLLHPKPSKPLPQPVTPPPIVASGVKEEENEEERIMAELQVFQKCTVKDVGAKCVAKPLVSTVSPEEKNAELELKEKEPDENGNDTLEHDPRVIYCVTAQVPPWQPSPGADGLKDQRNGAATASQVQSVSSRRASSGQVATRSSPGRPGAKHQSVLTHMRSPEHSPTSPAVQDEDSLATGDNIAFMITDTKVQALSCGEFEEIVSMEGENVQTIKVDNSREVTGQVDGGFDKKPVIIIFDEPMDIRTAYNRLSTIFECEEELDWTTLGSRDKEAAEESSEEVKIHHVMSAVDSPRATLDTGSLDYRNSANVNSHNQGSSWEASILAEGMDTEPAGDGKRDAKKKFRLKVPKKKLSALSQAIRTGTRTGKKTLQVVVYEDEEESDGTTKQLKEAKRFEIGCNTSEVASTTTTNTCTRMTTEELLSMSSKFNAKTDESGQNTPLRLEEIVKQREISVSGSSPKPMDGLTLETKRFLVPPVDPAAKDPAEKGIASPDRVGPLVSNATKPPQKRPKPQLLPRPAVVPRSTATDQQTQNVSTTAATSWTPSATSTKTRMKQIVMEKAGKQQKLQEAQSQFRQVVLL